MAVGPSLLRHPDAEQTVSLAEDSPLLREDAASSSPQPHQTIAEGCWHFHFIYYLVINLPEVHVVFSTYVCRIVLQG